jgi:hypothetical protein
LLAHIANAGETVGRLIELGGGFEISIFGRPSAELSEAMAASNPTVYGYFQGK